MTIRDKSMSAATVTLVGLLSACATGVPPQQLVDARLAYASSSQGLAARLSPTELDDAKKVLDKANTEFDEHGDTHACRDFAYIAQRKVQLADVKARTALDRETIAEAVKAGVVVRDIQETNGAQRKELNKTSAQLETEKQARLSAESKLAGAMKDLAAVTAVKEEARGTVITLSGSVLFASGRFALLDTAMTKLDQVAEALKAQDADKRMVVEGHTDSQGSDKVNQPLSLNRGNAVRDYLVSRGVASDKITAVGMGSSRPIVDNKTAENRASNRRVEIVISSTTISAR